MKRSIVFEISDKNNVWSPTHFADGGFDIKMETLCGQKPKSKKGWRKAINETSAHCSKCNKAAMDKRQKTSGGSAIGVPVGKNRK